MEKQQKIKLKALKKNKKQRKALKRPYHSTKKTKTTKICTTPIKTYRKCIKTYVKSSFKKNYINPKNLYKNL